MPIHTIWTSGMDQNFRVPLIVYLQIPVLTMCMYKESKQAITFILKLQQNSSHFLMGQHT